MDRATVEQLGHVTLPASATDLRVHAAHGIDPAVWARFDVAAADVEPFLTAAGYTDLSTTRRWVENWHLTTGAPWWTPDELLPFRSGRVLRDTRRPRYAGHVLVGGDGDTRTVYLMVIGL
jgi:hypothetical protein